MIWEDHIWKLHQPDQYGDLIYYKNVISVLKIHISKNCTCYGVVSIGVVATIISFIRKSSWTIISTTFQTTFTITVIVTITLILITFVRWATTILICISSRTFFWIWKNKLTLQRGIIRLSKGTKMSLILDIITSIGLTQNIKFPKGLIDMFRMSIIRIAFRN